MRITGGELRGRILKSPPDKVRPTQDRVRAAMFSALAERIPGCRFLDLFAGSGAVGLEAWSRGAEFVCWVESDPAAMKVLSRNVAELCKAPPGGPAQTQATARSDAIRFLRDWRGDRPFDIIFADPPYDRDGDRGWLRKALQAMGEVPILAVNGLLVFEQGADEPCEFPAPWTAVRDKAYGSTRLLFLVRNEG